MQMTPDLLMFCISIHLLAFVIFPIFTFGLALAATQSASCYMGNGRLHARPTAWGILPPPGCRFSSPAWPWPTWPRKMYAINAEFLAVNGPIWPNSEGCFTILMFSDPSQHLEGQLPKLPKSGLFRHLLCQLRSPQCPNMKTEIVSHWPDEK